MLKGREKKNNKKGRVEHEIELSQCISVYSSNQSHHRKSYLKESWPLQKKEETLQAPIRNG